MNLRPASARWFELLTTREDLTGTIEALAHTHSVELETRSATHARLDLTDLRARIEAFRQLERRYHAYWPPPDLDLPVEAGKPSDILDAGLDALHDWEVQAIPLVEQLEKLSTSSADMRRLVSLLQHEEIDELDFSLLSNTGTLLTAGIYVIPAEKPLEQLPASVLFRRLDDGSSDFIVAVGPMEGIAMLGREVSAAGGRSLQLPSSLPAMRSAALTYLREHGIDLETRQQAIRGQLDALAAAHQLTRVLTGINRLEWLLTQVTTLPVTENFAWVTGWTGTTGDELGKTLESAGINAVVGFPPAPPDMKPPMLMRNPWWVQPFEVFARLLGTPSADEADPSLLLAILAPLLFGYMFGDIGHGLVLLISGTLLRKRWPLTNILIPNGLAAILFGFVFGSVFGREDLIPALWLHPLQDPLSVLLVPLGGGILVLLLGLLLNAVEFFWRRRFEHWLQTEAAVILLYVSLLASLLDLRALIVSAIAIAWYVAGNLLQSSHATLTTLLKAAGALLESTFQLVINTISFVRVGAFALAHGGLSLAFITLAGATGSVTSAVLVQIIGNLVVIMLEGLVVTIQTTRLILFEFFIRFLQCTGRMFRPLTAPDCMTNTRREL